MKQIINYFTDTDLYTFSVALVVMNKFPRAYIRYNFFDRNNTVYSKEFVEELRRQIKLMENIVPTEGEIKFLKEKCYYFPNYFFDFLKSYRFDSNEVSITHDENGHLHIEIEGLWFRTIFWEVPILAIISEIEHTLNGEVDKLMNDEEYFKLNFENSYHRAEKLLKNGVVFSDFGTRRRFSFDWHKKVIESFVLAKSCNYKEKGAFVGTSNVYLAYFFKENYDEDLKIIGTMSHQYVTSIAAMYGPVEANSMAMKLWRDVYGTDLGIYLYDSLTWNAFESNFSKLDAKAFDGLRVDSGDNFDMTDKIIAKYNELGINPFDKTIVYSNGLDVDDAIAIKNHCRGKIQCSFGIGTKFTCNLIDVKPKNIVIKATEVKITEKRKWNKVVKLSDDLGKHTGDNQTIEIYKYLLQLP